MEDKLNRADTIIEILERLETELDELNNVQLANLLTEYEHIPMLSGLIEDIADEGDEEEEALSLIDGEWNEETDDD